MKTYEIRTPMPVSTAAWIEPGRYIVKADGFSVLDTGYLKLALFHEESTEPRETIAVFAPGTWASIRLIGDVDD